jgi:hypothetical protein
MRNNRSEKKEKQPEKKTQKVTKETPTNSPRHSKSRTVSSLMHDHAPSHRKGPMHAHSRPTTAVRCSSLHWSPTPLSAPPLQKKREKTPPMHGSHVSKSKAKHPKEGVM